MNDPALPFTVVLGEDNKWSSYDLAGRCLVNSAFTQEGCVHASKMIIALSQRHPDGTDSE